MVDRYKYLSFLSVALFIMLSQCILVYSETSNIEKAPCIIGDESVKGHDRREDLFINLMESGLSTYIQHVVFVEISSEEKMKFSYYSLNGILHEEYSISEDLTNIIGIIDKNERRYYILCVNDDIRFKTLRQVVQEFRKTKVPQENIIVDYEGNECAG